MKRSPHVEWLHTLLAELIAQAIKTREPARTWVPRNIVLPREVSQVKPGRFDPDVTPLTSLVYDWFDDPQWRELIVVKGSQGGLSQAAQNLSVYIAEHQLGDIMWTLESDKKVVELNNERLKPMITRSCESLKRHLFEDEDKLKNRAIFLKGLKIIMAGARTASGVASRPIPFHFGDEVDEWPIELQGNESNALDLLRERAKLFPWAKLMFFSKPRNALTPEMAEDHKLRNRKKKDDGIIWGEFLGGTRHKCHIPCPRCGHFHELLWENVRFKHCQNASGTGYDFARMEDETHFLCPECQHQFRDEEKNEMMLKHRRWVRTNVNGDEGPDGSRVNLPVPRRMSAHMSDLYVNTREFPTLTIGRMAVEYCSADTTSKRRAFRRGHLGLPVEHKAFDKVDVANILALQGRYAKGTLPALPAFACFNVDVQEHGKLYRWQKLAFALDDTAWVFDEGETDSDEEIEFIMDKPVPVQDELGSEIGRTITTKYGWVDEGDGNTTNQVLNLCIRPKLYRRLCPVKGRGGSQTEHMKDRVELQDNRTHKGRAIDRYRVDSDYFLDELYEQRIARRKEIDAALHSGNTPPAGRLWIWAEPSKAFCSEYTTEKKDYHMRGGKLVFGWLPKPQGGKNDHSDLTKYGLAIWYRTKPKILEALARQKARDARAAAAREEALTKTQTA